MQQDQLSTSNYRIIRSKQDQLSTTNSLKQKEKCCNILIQGVQIDHSISKDKNDQ